MNFPQTNRTEFDELGYTILPDVVSRDQLQILREECAYLVGYIDGSVKARGRET